MPHFHKVAVCACAAVISTMLSAGCAATGSKIVRTQPTSNPASDLTKRQTPDPKASDVVAKVSHSESTDRSIESNDSSSNTASVIAPALGEPDDPFAGAAELPLPQLVNEVLQRNASLQAALAAWQAAAQRYPQEVAFDDPVLQSMAAPASFRDSSPVQSSYFVGVAQKVPWSGKRELRGQRAQWEANAMSLDYQDSQLRLTEATRLAFFDYFLVYRNLELNKTNLTEFEKFRDAATRRFENKLVTQQDVLQAEVEVAKLDRRRLELERTERVTIARINTLLHRRPNHSLPPPPHELNVSDELPNVDFLHQIAIEKRPDLAAQAARIQAEQNAVALACKEFYPDFEFMGRYDAFWTDRVQRGQVGMNVNVPLNQNRRRAAVNEALFRVSKLQAEYNQQVDNIRNEVEASFARLDESRKVVRLYAEKILPAAQGNVRSAASEYMAGNVDFLRLIAAQQELIMLQENNYEATADYFRRSAELERAVGVPLADAGVSAKVPPAIDD